MFNKLPGAPNICKLCYQLIHYYLSHMNKSLPLSEYEYDKFLALISI